MSAPEEDIKSMSLKELKAKISALGGSAAGCVERADLEKVVRELREHAHDRRDHSDGPAARRSQTHDHDPPQEKQGVHHLDDAASRHEMSTEQTAETSSFTCAICFQDGINMADRAVLPCCGNATATVQYCKKCISFIISSGIEGRLGELSPCCGISVCM
jgi:hypothetical protein